MCVVLLVFDQLLMCYFILFYFDKSVYYIPKKKAPSASKYTRKMQSASSIQRKPKSPKPLSTQKVYKGTQKQNRIQPKTGKGPKQHPTGTALVLLQGDPSAPPEGTKTHFSIPTSLVAACLSPER